MFAPIFSSINVPSHSFKVSLEKYENKFSGPTSAESRNDGNIRVYHASNSRNKGHDTHDESFHQTLLLKCSPKFLALRSFVKLFWDGSFEFNCVKIMQICKYLFSSRNSRNTMFRPTSKYLR